MFAFHDTLIDDGAVIAARDPAEVPGALARLQAALDDGFHAGGFFAYELGYVLEPKLAPLLPSGRALPLLWFTVSKNPKTFASSPGSYALGPAQTMDRAAYMAKCQTVIDNIHAGEIYQANLTFRARMPFSGSPRALFHDLRARQPTPYAACIETPDFSIASLSPELFFHLENGKIITRPMKGTAPRDTPVEALRGDPKQRAENLMIVDLMRNDLSRIGKNIRVEDMFAIETHPTLHQMTSTVIADTDARLETLLAGLFPAGSITGAPKIRAMEIIRDLEDAPRGVYCGAIGLLHRDRMVMNVAIRTITMMNGVAEIGIGSGVVADSDPASEYAECLLKMKFLTPDVALIESFAKKNGVYDYYAEHIARLTRSAAHFSFTLPLPAIERDLAAQPDGMIRLLLQRDGRYTITVKPLPVTPPMRVALSPIRLDSKDTYLFHKTTRRALYDTALERHPGFDEVIFMNERGELCEGARTNLFIERDGVLLTPALSCGLLPGTLRAHLLTAGRAKEAVLYPADLAKGAVFLGNGVRGLIPATVVI